MGARKAGRPGWLTLILSVILGFVAFLVSGIAMVFGELLAVDAELFGELIGALCAMGFVALLGGVRWMIPKFENIGFALRFGWWCLAVTFGLLVFDLLAYPVWGQTVSSRWPIRLVEITVLCLSIGIFEEFIFRGLLLQGLLAVMGKRFSGVVAALILSSALFGLAHVDITVEMDTPVMVGQAIMKAVQTGMFGFMLGVITLRRKDLIGPSFFHGFDDWALLVVSYAFFDEDVNVSYVSNDADEGLEMLVFYIIVCVLYLPFVIKSVRELMGMREPNRGAFVPEDEPVASFASAPYAPVVGQAPQEWGYAAPAYPSTQGTLDATRGQMASGGPWVAGPTPAATAGESPRFWSEAPAAPTQRQPYGADGVRSVATWQPVGGQPEQQLGYSGQEARPAGAPQVGAEPATGAQGSDWQGYGQGANQSEPVYRQPAAPQTQRAWEQQEAWARQQAWAQQQVQGAAPVQPQPSGYGDGRVPHDSLGRPPRPAGM